MLENDRARSRILALSLWQSLLSARPFAGTASEARGIFSPVIDDTCLDVVARASSRRKFHDTGVRTARTGDERDSFSVYKGPRIPGATLPQGATASDHEALQPQHKPIESQWSLPR